MTRTVTNGYRVVWDLGYYIDTEDADYALDLYLGLCKLPAFLEDLRRPRIVRVSEGELIFPIPT